MLRSSSGGRQRTSGRETAARWLVRNTVLYLATGVLVLARRWWEARTQRPLRAADARRRSGRGLRAAHRLGARARAAREQRHRRRMDWITAPLELARTAAVLVLSGSGSCSGWARCWPSRTATPLGARPDCRRPWTAVAWVVWLLGVIWRPRAGRAAGGWCWPGCGRSAAAPAACPRWAAPTGARVDPTVIITPGGVAAALAHLGIPAMNRAVKDGWQVEFATPPVRVNRRGYQTMFSLPMGVTPEMIADKRDVLARNLVRAPLEVWPAAAERAGYVDLWVADPGLDRTAGPALPAAARRHAPTCSPGCRSGCRSAGT